MCQAQGQPRDASTVLAILRSMGVEEFEPSVLHQLMAYMHRYCAEVFHDGADFAEHSGRAGQLECEDVLLAVRLREKAAQTVVPPLIDWLARTRNKEKLPAPHPSLKSMPQLELCLMQPNYQQMPAGARGRGDEELGAAHVAASSGGV